MDELMIKNLFSLNESLAGPFMEEYTYPWEVLPHIGEIIRKIGESLDKKLYTKHDGDVWIANSVKFYGGFGSNVILGPTIIGENTEVRPGAFIRGNVLVGNNCVVGNSTELKNVILFNKVQVPHYNYTKPIWEPVPLHPMSKQTRQMSVLRQEMSQWRRDFANSALCWGIWLKWDATVFLTPEALSAGRQTFIPSPW